MIENFPWEDPTVRDEQKMISLQLPEVTKLKIKWLSEQTGMPQKKTCAGFCCPQ